MISFMFPLSILESKFMALHLVSPACPIQICLHHLLPCCIGRLELTSFAFFDEDFRIEVHDPLFLHQEVLLENRRSVRVGIGLRGH